MKSFLLIVCLLMISCKQPDYEYITNSTWEYDHGNFLIFDTARRLFDLKNDTILYNGLPRAIIKNLDKKYFELTVLSLDGKKSGIYVAEAEHIFDSIAMTSAIIQIHFNF